MTAARGSRVVGGVAIAMLALAGCTSSATSGTGETISTAPTSSAAPVSSPPAPSDTPTPTPTPTAVTSTTGPSTAPSTTAVPTTSQPAPPTSTAPPVSPSTCRNVGVRVIQGGAERGAEIAALQFVNTGTTSCQLGGFPTVTLLRGGQPVGTPSQSSVPTPRTLTLQPGDTVESLLRDYSTCQAPLSDAARVTVPGETVTVVRPIQLRACTLRAGPLGAPA